MASNCTGTNCVSGSGSATIRSNPIMAVGGLQGSSNFASGTKLQPHSSEQRDPYASVPNPPPQSNCTEKEVGNHETFVIPAGACYTSLNIKGTATASGPVFIYGGDLEFGSQANVSGSNVTFVMTGPNGAAGDLKMNAQAKLDLSAPPNGHVGDYDGLLFYRDRRASNIDIKINGGSEASLTGAMYFPSSDVTFNGNAGFTTNCFQLIGQILTFRGGASINNGCTIPGLDPTFRLEFVRLVK
jgi:hypothetical protein